MVETLWHRCQCYLRRLSIESLDGLHRKTDASYNKPALGGTKAISNPGIFGHLLAAIGAGNLFGNRVSTVLKLRQLGAA
jgi:hypothetical protein